MATSAPPKQKYVTPWSTIGYLTLKRTYARRLDPSAETGPTEEFPDIIDRIIRSANDQLKCNFNEDEQEELRKYFTELKGVVAGRFLWQMGTDTVDRLGLASLQNCAFVVIDNPIRPFTWAMDMLMLGSGVGYNIQRENINKLPKVNESFTAPIRQDNSSAEFIVPDTREGWVSLLGKTLKAAFLSDKENPGFTYSTQLIRGKGSPIKGFGGTASGAVDLCWGIEKISAVLEKRAGEKIRPIDALDIMNIIGAVVVAGNVRRSAQIAIGDYDDVEYLLAKRWDMGNIPSWRAMSNNSIVCDDVKKLHEYFWDGYEGKGEPYGLINMKLSRAVGRLGETQYPDKDVMGYNPCVVGGTLVHVLVDGKRETMRIQDLVELFKEKPIKVLSYNGTDMVYASVTKAWLSKTNAELVRVTDTESGKQIICTPDHKIFTHNRGYVRADSLMADDVLEIKRV